MIRALLPVAVVVSLLPAGLALAGSLRLLAHSAAGTLDPQVNYTAQYWQLFALTHDGLVAFRKVPGPAGLAIVADLAEAVPEPEDEGRLYRFRLRPGIRFSDGRPVRAADVLASLRRMFRVHSPTAETFFGGIVGAAACLRDADDCALEGVSATDDAVTIRLERADPEFLAKLALPPASVLPADAPPTDAGTVPIAGTGAFRFGRYDPNDRLELTRNPFFRQWSADAQPASAIDRIDYEFGLEDESEVTAVLHGQADWMFDTPPADRLGSLPAGTVHLHPTPALWFVPLNTRIPPFDDLRVRRALDLAVDRAAAVKLFGGPHMAEATCRFLPPGLPGARPGCGHGVDLPAARRLVAEAGAAGAPVTLITDDSPVGRTLGTFLRDTMAAIGLAATVRSLSGNVQFTFIQNTANRVQASLTSWYADYPSSKNFLLSSFGCAAFHPDSDSSTNIPGFCDPAIDSDIERAAVGEDAAGFAAVDDAIAAAAPAVVLFSPRYVDLLSPRVEGYAYHEVFHWLIGAARVAP